MVLKKSRIGMTKESRHSIDLNHSVIPFELLGNRFQEQSM